MENWKTDNINRKISNNTKIVFNQNTSLFENHNLNLFIC